MASNNEKQPGMQVPSKTAKLLAQASTQCDLRERAEEAQLTLQLNDIGRQCPELESLLNRLHQRSPS